MAANIRIVPAAPQPRSAHLWFGIAATGRPPARIDLTITPHGQASIPVSVAAPWVEVCPGAGYWSARATIRDLQPNHRYAVRLQHNSDLQAVVRTLPSALPNWPDGDPFVLLLGSCFSVATGKNKPLGSAVRALDRRDQPHLKILCGDQVYLDLPVTEDLPQDLAKLRQKVVSKYLQNWIGIDDHANGPGFGSFLSQGSNLFVSDDHEFWNNYPNRQAHLPITWPGFGARDRYEQVAKEAYQGFQADYAHAAGSVQSVSLGTPGEPGAFEVAAIDGRFFRHNWDRAHRREDLDAVIAWIRNLKNPAALVLSQPLFLAPEGWFDKRVVDASLADYGDYKPLARALANAPHDLLILSGDIHRASYATARSKHLTGASAGRAIHEIVASPLSLIPGKHKRGRAHTKFPDPSLRGSPTLKVRTRLGGLMKDQFALVKLSSLNKRIMVELEYWGTSARSGTPHKLWPTQPNPTPISLQ